MQTVLFLKSQRARLALQYHSSVLNPKSQMAGLCCLIHGQGILLLLKAVYFRVCIWKHKKKLFYCEGG